MARQPLPTSLPVARTTLLEAKERILELRTKYADRHQRVLDKQSTLRETINAQFDALSKAGVDSALLDAALAAINSAFSDTTVEMQAVEDTEPDKPIDQFPDKDLPAKPGTQRQDTTPRG